MDRIDRKLKKMFCEVVKETNDYVRYRDTALFRCDDYGEFLEISKHPKCNSWSISAGVGGGHAPFVPCPVSVEKMRLFMKKARKKKRQETLRSIRRLLVKVRGN